jgi:hypothetical protein
MGVLLPVLIGAAGLGTEVGLWFFRHQSMQGAADSAALSAAVAYYTQGVGTNAAQQAKSVTSTYGFTDGVAGTAVTVDQPPASGAYAGNTDAIEVAISQPQKRLFSALWSSDPVPVGARAVAIVSNTQGCVLALNASAVGTAAFQGTADVVLKGCSLFDNSNSSSALTINGSSSLTALSVGVVGGVSGKSDITTDKGVFTGQSPISDPYSGVSFPGFSGCTQNNYTAKNTVTLSPGVYCNGLKVNAGADVTLSPGIYYIDRGSFSVNGGASVTGNGVTLVFTSSSGSNYATATINGGANINLTAPTSGPTEGIAIFGDRDMPEGASFKFNGGSSQSVNGAIYVPKGDLTFAGGSNTGGGCTQIIASTVTFTGNSNLAVDCRGHKTRAIGTITAKLVQ